MDKAIGIIKEIFQIANDEILEINRIGGMTNVNFYVETINNKLILRLPGKSTDKMINRDYEDYNSKITSINGINCDILYCNKETGIKISEYIEGAETLNPVKAKKEKNTTLVGKLLSDLHNSSIKFKNTFNVFFEFNSYMEIAKKLDIEYYKEFNEVVEEFYILEKRLQILGVDIKPCHNDLVAENFIKGKKGRMYLIDWEYSGMNDPFWDIASYSLECGLNKYEEELLMRNYITGIPKKIYEEKILIFKITQDVLWSLWTLIKESQGEDFGTYGIDRFDRAKQNIKKYKEKYGDDWNKKCI